MIGIGDYLKFAHSYRHRQAIAYVQVLACTSPRVDADGSIICESVAGAMTVQPDTLHLKIRMFYDRENPYSLRQELSMLRLADRFGILPPSNKLYIAVTRYGERVTKCRTHIFSTTLYINAHGRRACVSDTEYACGGCSYSMRLPTQTIYRMLAKQLREQVSRLRA